MSFYTVSANPSTPAASDTIIHLRGSATVRGGLCEVILSSDGTPSDTQSAEYFVTRTTSTGTTPDSTPTPHKKDQFSPSAGIVADVATTDGYATEPTPSPPGIADALMAISVHQKNTFRWIAYPGQEIWSLAAASNGLGLVISSLAGAPIPVATVSWKE